MDESNRDTSESLLSGLQHSQDKTLFNASWERFNEKYVPRMYRWARDRGLSRVDAEEVTQDLMVCLLRRLKTLVYDPSMSFRAWLKTVTKRAAGDYWEKRQREKPTDQIATMVEAGAFETQLDALFDLELLAEAKLRVVAKLNKSETGQRNYFIFTQLNESSVTPEELAEQLDVTRQAIYVARNRVLMMLKVEVEQIRKRGL